MQAVRVFLLVLVLAVLPAVASAQMYRWVDGQGEVHITNDLSNVPEQYRPRTDKQAPKPTSPAAPVPRPGISSPGGSSGSSEPIAGKVTLWLRTGGMRGEQEPILVRTYDGEAACLAERDRRVAAHVSQGMQATNQPGLAISNLGASPTGSTYFAYRCAPAGIRP